MFYVVYVISLLFFFFFQAEDGIRDYKVTGVQTCALPICSQRMLAQHGIVCSMSRRGDCWDNAVAESFFATLKVELVHDAAWATRAAARAALFEYLELFYNGQRRHSALGYLSPRAFERRLDHEASAA